jgi:hypothetical protein
MTSVLNHYSLKLRFTIGFYSFTARTSPAVSKSELVIFLLAIQAAVRRNSDRAKAFEAEGSGIATTRQVR